MTHSTNSQFEQQLDELLKEARFGETPGDDSHDELMQIATRLATTDLSKRSQIQHSLYQKLSSRASTTQGVNNMTFKFKHAVAVLMAAVLLALTAPTITTFAQSILAQIGEITVTNETENLPENTITVEDMAVTPTPIPVDVRENVQTAPITNPDGAVATFLNAAGAAAMANFDIVREPATLPAGYSFSGRAVFASNGSTRVESHWISADGGYVSLFQSRGDAAVDYKVGAAAQASDVTISDLPATLITNADMSHSDGLLFNLLIWEDGDYTFVLMTWSLDGDALQGFANALYQ